MKRSVLINFQFYQTHLILWCKPAIQYTLGKLGGYMEYIYNIIYSPKKERPKMILYLQDCLNLI